MFHVHLRQTTLTNSFYRVYLFRAPIDKDLTSRRDWGWNQYIVEKKDGSTEAVCILNTSFHSIKSWIKVYIIILCVY